MIQSIRKSCFGSIVKGSSNFWIGSIANGIRRKLYLQTYRAEGFALIGSTKVRWTEAPGRFLKWTEGEKGRRLSWEQLRQEWTDAYQQKYDKFLIDTLYFLTQIQRRSRPRPERAVHSSMSGACEKFNFKNKMSRRKRQRGSSCFPKQTPLPLK
jgi:hypothetical protein